METYKRGLYIKYLLINFIQTSKKRKYVEIRTPCEWTLSDFVPKIRRELVKELHEKKNYNQKQIANILGISQPRVSQYLTEEKKQIRKMETQQFQLLEDQLNPIVTRTVNDIVEALDNGLKAPETIPIICYSCRELRTGSALCTLHRFDYPDLESVISPEKNCSLCLHWGTAPSNSPESKDSLNLRLNVLQRLESISKMLISLRAFVNSIPQIGAQLCLIFEGRGPDSSLNIAGFPGRIVQFKDGAKIVSRPEFNASKTTGSLLISIRKLNKKLSAVLSIKNQNDEKRELTFAEKGFSIIKTLAIDENGLENQLTKKDFPSTTKIAIIDSGSVGYESISYLFVENIDDLVDIFD